MKTAKVSGVVKLDGSPLDGAEVNFVGSEFAGVATTDASGRFEMEAQPGDNLVFIRKYEGVGPSFDETMIDSVSDAGGGGPKQLVPAKYSDQANSELSFTVPDSGAENADFDL